MKQVLIHFLSKLAQKPMLSLLKDKFQNARCKECFHKDRLNNLDFDVAVMKPSEGRFKEQNDQMGSDKAVNLTEFSIHSINIENYNDSNIYRSFIWLEAEEEW